MVDEVMGSYGGVEMCRLEQEFYWAIYHILDVDNSGGVTADEFNNAATVLTGDFAFGDSSSLIGYLMDNVSNDWDLPRVSVDMMAEFESDLSEDDFFALQIIVEFLD